MAWQQDRRAFRRIPLIVRSFVMALVLAGCSYTIEPKPGSIELIQAQTLSEKGNKGSALTIVEAGIRSARDPEIRGRLHYDRARLLDRSGKPDPDQLLRDLEAARRDGYIPATIFLAELHEQGRLGAPDFAAAARLYDEARAYDPRAGLALARLIKQGHVHPRAASANRLVADSVKRLDAQLADGNPRAARDLAKLYAEGVLVPANAARAEGYFAQAIRLGDASATADLAVLWVSPGQQHQPRRAELMLQDAARKGALPAMVQLGRGYRDGTFGNVDLQSSVHWLRSAIEQGEAGLEVDLAQVLLRLPERGLTDIREAVSLLDDAVASGNATAAVVRGQLHAEGIGGPVQMASAVSLFELARSKGSAEGAEKLGHLYAEGNGVQPDSSRAVQLWEEALRLGSRSVYKDLGEAYARGLGVPRNLAKAREYLLTAAESGSVSATTTLAGLYEEGISGPPDLAAAAKWYELAANEGSVGAAASLGRLHERGVRGLPDMQSALRWYEKAAAGGSVQSMSRLAELYGDEASPVTDLGRSVHWWQLAANAGSASALFELARAYGQGRGVPQDTGRAADLLEKWALERPDAAAVVARAYADGSLGFRDLGAAYSWYTRAAADGDARAMREVAQALDDGRGTARNPAAAASWYRRAAEAGDVIAMRRIGERLISSSEAGAAQQAIAFWKRAAAAADVASMRLLAKAFAGGLGGEIELSEAARWYEAAARAGDGEAQYQLGMMYLQGLGVNADRNRARSWLEAARRNNMEMAQAGLDALSAMQ